MNRVIFDCIILLSVFLLPWWVVLVLCVAGVYLFDQFYESVIFTILFKVLYIYKGHSLLTSDLYFPIVIILIYYFLTVIKKYVFIRNNDI